MPTKKRPSYEPEDDNSPAMSDVINDRTSCGNCGRRIQSHQPSLEVFNTRFKSYEHYHESYLGCYESTRPSDKPKMIMNRFKPWLNAVYNDPLEPVNDASEYTNII